MKVCKKLITFLIFAAGSVSADEPDACRTLAYDHTRHTASELREFARQCTSPTMRKLNNHRAYHLRLLNRFNIYTKLETWSAPSGTQVSNSRYAYTSFKLFIHMAETLARQNQSNKQESTVKQLNSAYEKANEIAELRLKGNDARADWLLKNGDFSQVTH